MRVFRIETADGGVGPFSVELAHGRYIKEMETTMTRAQEAAWVDNHPAPWRDGIDFIPGYHRCGVATLADALDWFPYARQHTVLMEFGFVVNEYEVADDDALVGGHQIAFFPPAARKVVTHSIEEMSRA